MMKLSSDTENKDVLSLITDLRRIIEQARCRVAATANYELTMMYWHIGERINRDILDNERAAYGQRIVATVSRQLWWSHFLEVLPLKKVSRTGKIQMEVFRG